MIGWLRFLWPCRHPHRYRERREQILMLVCESCGDAVPAIHRTPAEHRDVLQAGAFRPYAIARVKKEQAQNVTPIRARRQR